MFLGLRTAIYQGTQIDRALGQVPYFDQPFYVGFNVGGFELGLNPDAEPAGPGGSGVVAYWGVDDADRALARLLELGATPHSPVQDVGEGIKVASVRDPFGNVLGIIQNPHFTLPRQ